MGVPVDVFDIAVYDILFKSILLVWVKFPACDEQMHRTLRPGELEEGTIGEPDKNPRWMLNGKRSSAVRISRK